MQQLLELFLSFFKIGLFTFGGGLAMIPIIENICVDTRKWISHEDMMYITVIAESTPGPIAINCATFVGYKKKGIAGAVAATFGVLLPSFLIICLIAALLDHFLEYRLVSNAFQGIKLAVGILILDAALRMIQKMEKNRLSISLLIASTAAMLLISLLSSHFSSIAIMLLAGSVSLSIHVISRLRERIGERK